MWKGREQMPSRKRSRRFFGVLPNLVAVLCLTTVAAAKDDSRPLGPQTDPVAGTFTASREKIRQRTCVGPDGTYLELRGRWVGTSKSLDPRLAGDFEFTAETALTNLSSRFGTLVGRFTISDPNTGKRKAYGEFQAVVTEVTKSHGLAVGKVVDQGPRLKGGTLFANFKSSFDEAFNVAGEFGGSTGDPSTPAVILSGQCTGPWITMS
jgi:hypothetical protein